MVWTDTYRVIVEVLSDCIQKTLDLGRDGIFGEEIVSSVILKRSQDVLRPELCNAQIIPPIHRLYEVRMPSARGTLDKPDSWRRRIHDEATEMLPQGATGSKVSDGDPSIAMG